jgi:hypothetical protein
MRWQIQTALQPAAETPDRHRVYIRDTSRTQGTLFFCGPVFVTDLNIHL